MAITLGNSKTNNATGGNSFAVDKPDGNEGEVMVADILISSATYDLTPPSGWTKFPSTPVSTSTGTNSTNLRLFRYYKAVGASEPSSYTWQTVGGASVAWGGRIQNYIGVYTDAPLNVENSQSNADSANLTAPSIVTTVVNCLLIPCFAGGSKNAINVPSGFSERADFVWGNNSGRYEGCDKAQAAPGASGTIVAAWSAGTWTSVGSNAALVPGPITVTFQMSGGGVGGGEQSWAQGRGFQMSGGGIGGGTGRFYARSFQRQAKWFSNRLDGTLTIGTTRSLLRYPTDKLVNAFRDAVTTDGWDGIGIPTLLEISVSALHDVVTPAVLYELIALQESHSLDGEGKIQVQLLTEHGATPLHTYLVDLEKDRSRLRAPRVGRLKSMVIRLELPSDQLLNVEDLMYKEIVLPHAKRPRIGMKFA
jgi:hypothetical protein